MERPRVPLERVVSEAGSGIWGSEPDGSKPTYPVLRSTNIHDGKLVLHESALRCVAPKAAREYQLMPGDILVTTSSGSSSLLGKNAVVEELPGHFLYSNFTWRLRPDPEAIVPKFLFYYLNSPGARAELDRIQGTTSGLRNLNTKLYLRQAIPLPPLSEQRRIVEILDQADRLRRLRAEADAKSDRILPAILARMLGSPASWPSDPRSRPLADLADALSGATPSKANKEYWSGAVPWISPKDMKRRFLADSEDHVSETAVREANLKLVAPGNVLIVVRGMILARDVPVALNLVPVTINQDMKALIPKGDGVTGPFLWAALSVAETSLRSLIRIAAHGTRKLDTPELMRFRVVVPAAIEIARIDVAVGEHQHSLVRRETAKDKIDRLFAVLLSQAFEGALTASWREAHMKELLQEMEHQAKALATG